MRPPFSSQSHLCPPHCSQGSRHIYAPCVCHQPHPPPSLQATMAVLCPPPTPPMCTLHCSSIPWSYHGTSTAKASLVPQPCPIHPPQFLTLSAGSFPSLFKVGLSNPSLPCSPCLPVASLPLPSLPEKVCLSTASPSLPRGPLPNALISAPCLGNFSVQSQQQPACSSAQRPLVGLHLSCSLSSLLPTDLSLLPKTISLVRLRCPFPSPPSAGWFPPLPSCLLGFLPPGASPYSQPLIAQFTHVPYWSLTLTWSQIGFSDFPLKTCSLPTSSQKHHHPH